jgi:threonine dehydrogenase-like Zn-dependent dehydrogenase
VNPPSSQRDRGQGRIVDYAHVLIALRARVLSVQRPTQPTIDHRVTRTKETFMKALTVIPHQSGSAELCEVDEPPMGDGSVLVETLVIGICGTDLEILSGDYGRASPGRERLVLGHESLRRVLEAATDASAAKGDLVVGIVRRPDSVPGANCAVMEWDFCRNGRYTERGIKEFDGYLSERYRIAPEFVVKVGLRI